MVARRGGRAAAARASMAQPLPKAMSDAAAGGGVAQLTKWLKKGGKVDATLSDTKLTLLMVASQEGQDKVVELLLLRGASLELRDHQGCTALTHAACSGHLAIVQRILRSGSDTSARADNGHTAFGLALRMKKIECANAIVEHTKPALEQHGVLAKEVYDAARDGDIAAVNAWLGDKGGHVDATYASPDDEGFMLAGRTLLTAASYNGREELVDALLERGASVDLQNSFGNSALMLAATAGHLAIVQRLLRVNA